MKFLSTIFLFLLSFSVFSQSGTQIMYQDQFGPATLDWVSTDASGFHVYSDGGSATSEIRVVYTGTRWEVQFGISDILYYSDAMDGPNPPNLAIGNWQIGPNGSGALMTTFSGTGTASVFPVDLVAFTAQVMDKNRVALNWNTASETDNDRFEVEASSTGEQFNLIGSVAGAGTHDEANEYTFYDESPGLGLRYYRLRQVDFDGTFDYSPVVSVELSTSTNTMNISPNPTSAAVAQLTYQATVNGEVNTEIFSMSGQKLLTQPQAVTEGQNNIALDLAGLKAGVYLVRIQVGKEVSSQRVVVK